jgi:long-chain acyl-CoA synthetase
MQGYFRQPDKTAGVLAADGWLKTGDSGYLDPDGYLFLQGRQDDQINVHGLKVYPREIEEALLEHPHVHEAGVRGVQTRSGRMRIVAWVVFEASASFPEQRVLRRFCRERLAAYKVPTRFIPVGQLPKGPSGKLLRYRLSIAL